MAFRSLIYFMIISMVIVLQISSGTILKRNTRGTESDLKCEELDKPDWSIESLKDVELSSWSWKCLNSRYTNITLGQAISKVCPDVFVAAKKGLIGFFQYYKEKTEVNLKAYDEDGESVFHLACQNGHLNIVKYLASFADKKVWEIESDKLVSLTPLMSAVSHGQLAIAKYLIDEMRIDSSYDRESKTGILIYATQGGNLPLIKYLIEDKNYPFSRDDQRLLYRSAESGNVDVLKYFVMEKNITTTVTGFTTSPLHIAAKHGRLEAVKFFVEYLGYKIDRKNMVQETAASKAVEGGSLPVLRYLIDEKGADLNVKTFRGDRLIHIAAFFGHLDIIKYLIDEKGVSVELKDNSERTPLHRAVMQNKFNVVKYLADEKMADLSARDKLKQNILHKAAYAGDVDQMKYLVDDKKMISQINDKDDNDRTPAMEAVVQGHLAVMKFLIDDRNASTTVVDKNGYNMLHIAVQKNQLEIVKYLVESKGLSVDSKTTANKTAVDLAMQSPTTITALREYLLEKTNE